MAKRSKTTKTAKVHSVTPEDWTVSDSYSAGGKDIRRGTELAIRGERGGRFRFVEHVRRSNGVEWITVIGGARGVSMYRSFRPDRISRVFPPRS